MKCWLNPSASILSAAIQLSLVYPTRVITHAPWRDAAKAGYRTPERGQVMEINAAKARAARIAKRQLRLCP